MASMWYIEYSRDKESHNEVTDKKVVTTRELNKMKKIDWVNILKTEELKDDWAVKCAKKDEWSKYKTDMFESYAYSNGIYKGPYSEEVSDIKDVPITVAGVGHSNPVRWLYSEFGKNLSAYNIASGGGVMFDISSAKDIQRKLDSLYKLRDSGRCTPNDVAELEERLRTLSNLETSGNDEKSLAGIAEGVKRKKGQKYYTYEDGVKKEHTARGPFKHVSAEQKKAAENARRYAHTPEAEKKRRKSISARGDGKILGDK